MYGGPVHSILQLLQDNNWKTSNHIDSLIKPYRVSTSKILSFHSEIVQKKNSIFNKFVSAWEWRNKSFTHVTAIPDNHSRWKFRDNKSKEPSHDQTLSGLREDSIERMKISWSPHVRYSEITKELSFNSYSWEGQFLKFLLKSESPILIATDGAHESIDQASPKSTSSFVLNVLDIRAGESLHSRQWENRTVIPLMSRVSILPQNFGATSTDIAHGEFCAFLMAEIALRSLPRVTISDSKAIREQMLKIRELESDDPDRYYIRSVAGGVGKFVSGIMKNLLFHSDTNTNMLGESKAMKVIRETLQARNSIFLDIAKGWTTADANDKENGLVGWEEQYFDKDELKPVLKVNSHQLDQSGTHIKTPPRYKTLIPNLAMLSANHHADVCADHGKTFPHVPFSYNTPPPYLRFFLTCGGKHIDRHVSNFCQEEFALLRVRKLKLKKTQGLLWRIIPSTTTSWNILQLYKGWLRSLLGLSSTHTRRIYKSEIYRECSKKRFLCICFSIS